VRGRTCERGTLGRWENDREAIGKRHTFLGRSGAISWAMMKSRVPFPTPNVCNHGLYHPAPAPPSGPCAIAAGRAPLSITRGALLQQLVAISAIIRRALPSSSIAPIRRCAAGVVTNATQRVGFGALNAAPNSAGLYGSVRLTGRAGCCRVGSGGASSDFRFLAITDGQVGRPLDYMRGFTLRITPDCHPGLVTMCDDGAANRAAGEEIQPYLDIFLRALACWLVILGSRGPGPHAHRLCPGGCPRLPGHGGGNVLFTLQWSVFTRLFLPYSCICAISHGNPAKAKARSSKTLHVAS
jgi:hypothetical protein